MSARAELSTDGTILWECPGCRGFHGVPTTGPKAWGFNGDLERPTLTPSVLIRTGDENGPSVCHCFVRDGRIEFLADCTHDHAGRTVDLPEVEGGGS